MHCAYICEFIKKIYTLKMKNKEWRRSSGGMINWLECFLTFWLWNKYWASEFMTSECILNTKSAYTHILCIEYELQETWTLLEPTSSLLKFKMASINPFLEIWRSINFSLSLSLSFTVHHRHSQISAYSPSFFSASHSEILRWR